MQEALRIQAFFTALPLAFGMLHLFLFAALPRLRSNLYDGLFLLCIAATIFLDFQVQAMPWSERSLLLLRLHRACLALSFVFGLRFFYEALLGRAPLQFRYLVTGLCIAGVIASAKPVDLIWPLHVLIVLSLVEGGRAMTSALLRRQEDSWLIAGGFLTFVVFASYDLLLDFELIAPVSDIRNAYQFGLIGVFVATSAFPSRSIARTSKQLTEQERLAQEQEVKRRVLEAEVKRAKAEWRKRENCSCRCCRRQYQNCRTSTSLST